MERANRILSQLFPQPVAGSLKSQKLEVPVDLSKFQVEEGYEAIANQSRNGKGSLKGKTLFITGASRGIGLAIALRAARDGANIVIAAKSTKEDPRLGGTIYTAAEEIERAGGKALAVQCDIRFEDQVQKAINQAVERFSGIDIVVNNASAISVTDTEQTSMKAYDLMHQINLRGTFLVTKLALPYLKKSKNPHVLILSPPLKDNFKEKWFSPSTAYSIAKFGMSLVGLGQAGEFRDIGIAVNCLWPVTSIATAAVKNILGGSDMISKSRTPEIMADAAHAILTSNSREVTGNSFLDELVLRAIGVTDMEKYNVVPGTPQKELMPDLFV